MTASELRRWLDRRDLTVEELVEAADRLLEAIAPEQRRLHVNAHPDVRTVRYYAARGVLPRPSGYAGGRARYGGGHLLRLLLVKRMQAEDEPLRRIESRLRGATDEDVLAALAEDGVAPADRPASAAAAGAAESRIALADGAYLHVPARTIGDPAARARLAATLDGLVRWLRPSPSVADDRTFPPDPRTHPAEEA